MSAAFSAMCLDREPYRPPIGGADRPFRYLGVKVANACANSRPGESSNSSRQRRAAAAGLPAALAIGAVVFLVALSGCGGGDGGQGQAGAATPKVQGWAAFPSPASRSLRELI